LKNREKQPVQSIRRGVRIGEIKAGSLENGWLSAFLLLREIDMRLKKHIHPYNPRSHGHDLSNKNLRV
jgi:hypothetical protein